MSLSASSLEMECHFLKEQPVVAQRLLRSQVLSLPYKSWPEFLSSDLCPSKKPAMQAEKWLDASAPVSVYQRVLLPPANDLPSRAVYCFL